jgi:hypothetical protein
MPEQFVVLVRIALITFVVTLFWAASAAYVYWDTHRRGLPGSKVLTWLLVVGLVPVFGFAAYALVRVIALTRPAGRGKQAPRIRRETALKHPSGGGPTPTLIASDLAKPTMLDPQKVAAVAGERRSATPGYALVVSAGADKGKTFLVRHLPAQIGRGADTAIALDGDLGVSRRHAELYQRGALLRIRDLQSTHGTQVNGRPIEDQSLMPGDVIQVGRSTLTLTLIEA